ESLNESLSESLNDSETKSIVKGELVFKDIDINSKKRTYALYIPTNYSSSSEFPIVFYFHGGGGDALNADKSTRFSQKAEEENFIVVYPQGTNRMFENRLLTWNTQFCCGYAMRNDVDDITFISELCKMLNEEYSINTSQVFATGFSNGGILAHHVGIELSHIFTSIAPVGSQIGGQATRNSQFYFPTRVPSHNISVLIINGELDSRVPFYGGVPQDGDDTNVYEWSSSSESLSYWLEVNNCDSNLAKTKYLNSNVRVESYCEEITEVDVRLINVKNGTHSWHGEEYEPLGGTQVSTSFNTTDYIWNFFMNNN
ncbi:MAG: alpha/beta hydrolase family esterase, partial [Candidatus Woesearchaeota archaeon]